MQENKITNRENYQKKKIYDYQRRIFALEQINYRTQDELNDWKKRIKSVCQCDDDDKIRIGEKPKNNCAAIFEEKFCGLQNNFQLFSQIFSRLETSQLEIKIRLIQAEQSYYSAICTKGKN